MIPTPRRRPLSTVCVLAGGLGTRLGERSSTTPKSLTEVVGEPFIFHQLRLLGRHGATRIVLCVGHLGDRIEAAVGRRYLGMDILYSFDGPALDGTLGALRRAAPMLGDAFLVLYGDTYLSVDYEDFDQKWQQSTLAGGMTVLHNRGRWDRSNVVYRPGTVARYDKFSDDPAMEWIDYGLGALRTETLSLVDADQRDLASLYQVLAKAGQLFGYEATERFYEIGTPRALAETEDHLRRATTTGAAP